MSIICRLANRQLLSKIAQYERSSLLYVRHVTMKPEPYKPVEIKNHDEHNMKLGRPMSPHLTIYAPQMTSMLSITHRMTGVVLSGYLSLFGLSAFLPYDFATFIQAVPNYLPYAMLFLIKLSMALPFSYHVVNGCRHLAWDMGTLLTMKEVYLTGYAALTMTFVMTAVLLCL